MFWFKLDENGSSGSFASSAFNPPCGMEKGLWQNSSSPLSSPICDTVNIREVIAFPMNKNAQDVMMDAPSAVEQKQLDDVHIKLNVD